MEVMGLHLPSAAFVPPDTSLRDALTSAAARRAAAITALGNEYLPIASIVDERSIVNAIVALLATGGSTNHTLHLVAIARAAGMRVDWDDFAELSEIVPLLARIYPNGGADVNHFHAAGGTGFLIRELLGSGLLHADTTTVMGKVLARTPKSRGSRTACSRGAQCRNKRRSRRAASDARSVRRRRRPEGPARQSRARRHQDFRHSATAPRRRSACRGIRRSGVGHRCVQGRSAVTRLRRRRALPRAARQRHAGAAPAHADAQLAAE